MSNFIIGTAGHIDHGKSALVKALTNIETDRFQEEKDRGITIDLGFAYLDLPDGNKIGIIDVPGHEKFIKNMLAGISGVDLVLLIVAADESIMPQTKEHIDILRYLDINDGIICITKKDLVEEDFLELVKEDIKDYVKGTIFENAIIVETSTKTLAGIEKLKEIIYEKYKNKKIINSNTDFRMPIDRAFSIKGLGTIITGTLIEGMINKNDEIEIFPSNKLSKARGIQVHNEDVLVAHAGQRVAVNIPGIDKKDINRGDIIAPKNAYIETDLIDVEFSTLKTTKRIIENNTRLRLYVGTTEVMCRINILNKENIMPGESVFAQLKLENKIVCKYNDKFVIRFYSPLETIGGGKILKSKTSYHKRFRENIINELKILNSGDSYKILENFLYNNFSSKNNIENIIKEIGLTFDKVTPEIEKLITNKKIVLIKNVYYSLSHFGELESKMIDFLNKYHLNNSLSSGVNKEEIRKKIFNNLEKTHFDILLLQSINNNIIKLKKSIISLKDFKIVYSTKEKDIYNKITNYYYDIKFKPLNLNEVFNNLKITKDYEKIYTNLVDENILVRITQSITIHNEHIETSKKLLIEYLNDNKEISLGEFRDLIHSSRKIVMPLLEYFDSINITERNENIRRLKKGVIKNDK
ncbi:MAG: selenocysteine-specific translation elongation factor [Bacillota bacterium]|nr:selenocysteine-specific translation elongation factor [Bacillota bacterium]